MIDTFKIQLPISSSSLRPQALVYNKGKRIMFETPTETVSGLFNNGELKIYVLAKVEGGNIEVIKRVQNQDW